MIKNQTKTEQKQLKKKRLEESMKSTFDMLKSEGLFKRFKSYEDWAKQARPKNK